MYKKALGMFLTGTLFFFCSCVDDTYDLANKEISTDIEIKGNKLALPLGSLKAFELGTWFEDLDIIETMEDGVYAFVQKDTIEPVEKTPHEILFDIPDQHIRSKINVSDKLPEIPEIPNIPNMSRASSMGDYMEEYLKDIPNPIAIDFNETNTFSFKNPISVQYMFIESVTLKEEMELDLRIKLDGLNILQDSRVDLDFTLVLPAFFNELHCDDPEILIKKNRVTVRQQYPIHSTEGFTIKLISKGLNFKNEESDHTGLHPVKDGDLSYLVYDGHINAEGEVQIKWTESDLLNNIKGLEEIGINLDCTFTPMYVKTLNGIFYEEFDKLERTFIADLGEQLASMKESGNYITLSEPQIIVLLNNAISIPINVDLDIIGKDSEGNPIASEEIHTQIPIEAARYSETTGEVMPDTSRLFITNNTVKNYREDFTNIEIENLAHLLEAIPDSICVSIHPVIDRSVTHHIDIYQALNISASYDIMMPFKIDTCHIAYSDTISVSLGETMETFENAGLKLKMSIANTMPLGLTLNFTALDENNVPVNDIVIAPIEIAQGNGNSIHDSKAEKNEVSLAIQNSNGNLSKLDKLKLDIVAETNNATMGLKGTQGIQISDIVIEISGDISTDDISTDDEEEFDEDFDEDIDE